MAPQASPAHIVLKTSLKSCLVNLPATIVSSLENANIIAQDVVVELAYQQLVASRSIPRSAFVGWTGFPSQQVLAFPVGRNGIVGSRGAANREAAASVELDPMFASILALSENQKIGIILHHNPPEAHTINIEPLTAADWDIMGLHADFLTNNFLSQVRALPNPSFKSDHPSSYSHPITLHLSPTLTVNAIVVSVQPQPSTNPPFVKISPDAEVIVAPKLSPNSSNAQKKIKDTPSKAILFRGVDRSSCSDISDDDEAMRDQGLKVWVHPSVLGTSLPKAVQYVQVSLAIPPRLIDKSDGQKALNEGNKPSSQIVAKLSAWNDTYSQTQAILSSLLCSCLSAQGMVGGLVRLRPASEPLDSRSVPDKVKDSSHRFTLKVSPFIPEGVVPNSSLEFGGSSNLEKKESISKFKHYFSAEAGGNGLLDGPLSNGMLLPAIAPSWPGGILKFDPLFLTDTSASWTVATQTPFPIDFEAKIQRPFYSLKDWSPGESLPATKPLLVGIELTENQLTNNLYLGSPTLLTGGSGAGKTNVAHLLAHQLRSESFLHTVYFPCKAKFTAEHSLSNIQEILTRVFATAYWGALLGGRSLVILDDLDSLCSAETEIGQGSDNTRSRNVSEILLTLVKSYCSTSKGVVLLATAKSKEALNNWVMGGNVFEDIVKLPAPNKEMRRKILESVLLASSAGSDAHLPGSQFLEHGLHHSISSLESLEEKSGFVYRHIDLHALADQMNGYMANDIITLVSRAQTECLLRNGPDYSDPDAVPQFLTVTSADFTLALKGFTPASIRNVSLQSSTVKWSSIGGLKKTRRILLETMKDPIIYAPLFASCHLRLPFGILLYGYPGCGKTLLASAIASECGINFISIKGPEILNKFIGSSEQSVRDLFDRAQAARPCILFFDEFDSIAPKRGHDSTGVTDRVVNQLLTQMDGAEGLEGVYVIGATSRPDLIDPALLRPGRLGKRVLCDMPDYDDRVDILRAISIGLNIDKDVKTRWGAVAARTEGYSGADLQALLSNAHLETVHDLLGDDFAKTKTRESSKRIRSLDTWLMSDSSVKSDDAKARDDIAAKLRGMHMNRRHRLGASKKQQALSDEDDDDNDDDDMFAAKKLSDVTEATVCWRHIVKALSETRPSINSEERGRLARIYGEFINARKGNLPNGEGEKGIGVRTSLM